MARATEEDQVKERVIHRSDDLEESTGTLYQPENAEDIKKMTEKLKLELDDKDLVKVIQARVSLVNIDVMGDIIKGGITAEKIRATCHAASNLAVNSISAAPASAQSDLMLALFRDIMQMVEQHPAIKVKMRQINQEEAAEVINGDGFTMKEPTKH